MPTKEELLAALREAGFDGPETAEAVTQFIADQGGLEYNGEPVTDAVIQELFGEAEGDDDDAEDDERSGFAFSKRSNPEALTKRVAELERRLAFEKGRKEKHTTRKSTDYSTGGGSFRDNARTLQLRAERKRYERKIESGKAQFSSPEVAEVAGAWARVNLFRIDCADSRRILKDAGVETRAHTLGNPVSAGNTVPVEVANDIISNFENYGVYAANSKVYTMGQSNTLEVPRNFEEMTIYRPGDGVAPPSQSDVKFNMVTLVARERMAFANISNSLLEDSIINLGEVFGEQYARAVGKSQDNGGFNGDGTSTYFGDVGLAGAFASEYGAAPATASGSLYLAGTTTHDGWENITINDLHAVVGLLPQYADDDAAWYCHRGFRHRVLDRLMTAAGGTTYAEIGGKRVATCLGYPIVETQVMPNTDDSANGEIVAYFGSLSRATKMGLRKDVRIDVSTDFAFSSDNTTIRGIVRDAINVHDVGTASGDAGPIIALQTDA